MKYPVRFVVTVGEGVGVGEGVTVGVGVADDAGEGLGEVVALGVGEITTLTLLPRRQIRRFFRRTQE